MVRLLLLLIILLYYSPLEYAQNILSDVGELQFDFTKDRTAEIQYYEMESALYSFAADGITKSTDVFKLKLQYVPAALSKSGHSEITCLQFTVTLAGSPEIPIPSLAGWTYQFNTTPGQTDSDAQVFGVSHAKFEQLKDASGNLIPPEKSYHVYNAFIDFHAFCDVFSEKIFGASGVQDLHIIGEKISHAAANTRAPINLGSNVADSSYFQNGAVTLELKGLSSVRGKTCALLEYDSGESSFYMKMLPMPGITVTTKGRSRYFGDLYKDIASGWLMQATLHEYVITDTRLPFPPNTIRGVAEREIILKNIPAL